MAVKCGFLRELRAAALGDDSEWLGAPGSSSPGAADLQPRSNEKAITKMNRNTQTARFISMQVKMQVRINHSNSQEMRVSKYTISAIMSPPQIILLNFGLFWFILLCSHFVCPGL